MSSHIVSLVHLYKKQNVSTELVMFFPFKTVGHVFEHGTLVFGVCVLCNFLIIFCIIIPNCIAEIFALLNLSIEVISLPIESDRISNFAEVLLVSSQLSFY